MGCSRSPLYYYYYYYLRAGWVCRILLDELAAAPKSLAMSIFNAVTKERCPIAVLPVSIVQALAKLYVEPLENDEVNRLMFAGFLGEEVGSWGWGRERCVCVYGVRGAVHIPLGQGEEGGAYMHMCVYVRERERESA